MVLFCTERLMVLHVLKQFVYIELKFGATTTKKTHLMYTHKHITYTNAGERKTITPFVNKQMTRSKQNEKNFVKMSRTKHPIIS